MNKRYSFPTAILFFMLSFRSLQQDRNNEAKALSLAADTNTVQTILDAYIYGLPLVLMDITRKQMTDPTTDALYAPPNQFRQRQGIELVTCAGWELQFINAFLLAKRRNA